MEERKPLVPGSPAIPGSGSGYGNGGARGDKTSGESLGAAGGSGPGPCIVELPYCGTKDLCPAVDVDWLT
ncbi:jg11237 [Pararge aegeria aegeria]|uniref:Jg11237 protein n=1 Tax=Pararge aegeria aegeria TaxID=348720 RepID=A0A8S4RL03_9NEOP|nr:jg11237 [Pararge aegeria aegeria]